MIQVCSADARQAYSRVKRIEWRRDFPDRDRLKNLMRFLSRYRQLLGTVCEQLELEVVSPCFDVCAAAGIQDDVPRECDPRDMLANAQVPPPIQDLCFYYVKAAHFQGELAARRLLGVELYEPIIALLESGWYFWLHHGDIDFGVAAVPAPVWRKGFDAEEGR